MSRKTVPWLASAATVVALAAAACSGGEPAPSSSPQGEPARGGTLKMAVLSDVQDAFDPQKEYYGPA